MFYCEAMLKQSVAKHCMVECVLLLEWVLLVECVLFRGNVEAECCQVLHGRMSFLTRVSSLTRMCSITRQCWSRVLLLTILPWLHLLLFLCFFLYLLIFILSLVTSPSPTSISLLPLIPPSSFSSSFSTSHFNGRSRLLTR